MQSIVTETHQGDVTVFTQTSFMRLLDFQEMPWFFPPLMVGYCSLENTEFPYRGVITWLWR